MIERRSDKIHEINFNSFNFIFQLNKAGQQLKILPHNVFNDKGESVELCSSVECKGIIGNDGRHYILDLLRTFPPDVNFLKCT